MTPQSLLDKLLAPKALYAIFSIADLNDDFERETLGFTFKITPLSSNALFLIPNPGRLISLLRIECRLVLLIPLFIPPLPRSPTLSGTHVFKDTADWSEI